MKILAAHNYYQHPGGEDGVFADEANLLERHGHSVVRFAVHNDLMDEMPPPQLISAWVGTIWNRSSRRTITKLIRRERPDVMHVHNTLPLLSPAVYHAARSEEVAVVQTLHNFRLLCPGALLYREGRICEDCLGRVPWPAVVHGCYRGSTMASGAVAAMLVTHRAMGTWKKTINTYISMTQFAKSKFVAGGIPEDKIVVKPHFVNADLHAGAGDGGYVLFAGRLTDDKGVPVLLDAWSRQQTSLRLKIAGDGPKRAAVERACRENPTIEWVGQRTPEEIYSLMSRATAVVVPSVWYETFGRVVAESFAVGTPVVVSRIGAIEELVHSGLTGLHFTPGDAGELARRFSWLTSNPAELAEMRKNARLEYEERFSSESNYRQLMAVYEKAIADARASS